MAGIAWLTVYLAASVAIGVIALAIGASLRLARLGAGSITGVMSGALLRAPDNDVQPARAAALHAGQLDLNRFSPEDISQSSLVRWSWCDGACKRVVDVAASLALLIGLSPVLILVAVLIKLDSPGPILYRQKRIGLGGRVFEVYKFRSMVADAERDGPRWAAKNDGRVTAIGRIIRKTRIDEIPQAINVLKDEMSFVGPRPERPEFVNVLEREIPHYHERHRVKPGITGWAQVKYVYGASVEDACEKLKFDLFYVKHFTPALDLLIILMTVRVALFGLGGR
ncbi:MAG: exopolysaccharide biosynthesis polyprenyl glycosylphosphotransferase [Parvularculaceae bacterium]